MIDNEKPTRLKRMITSPELSFLMEAHDGISAKIAQEAGFEGIWGSGLCIAAAMGVRDNNEATWTQVLDVAEFMSDITSIPILIDGDTGYGDFNTVRRVIRKLEQREVAGICMEDKLFPKTNSFIAGDKQAMATIDEFSGKIRAAKDSQIHPDFCVVARTEAFITGWGLGEALKRAEAYWRAGADAILVHSKKNTAEDIVAFMQEWKETCPIVIVPTKYYSTSTDVFRRLGISMVIWANHALRAAVAAMQSAAKKLYQEQSLVEIEERVASLAEIFSLQGAEELKEAEKKYLPKRAQETNAIILAASRGEELGSLTENTPKAMLTIQGKPLVRYSTETFNMLGIKDITIVRGFRKEAFDDTNANYVDNDEFHMTREVYSFWLARDQIKTSTIISFGDIMFKKYIAMDLLECQDDICIAVDFEWNRANRNQNYVDYVSCEKPYDYFDNGSRLLQMGSDLSQQKVNGEWIGMFMVKGAGQAVVKDTLGKLFEQFNFKRLRMADLFNQLVTDGHKVGVVYTRGHWLDVDDLADFSQAAIF